MITFAAIPIFNDNYVWVLTDGKDSAVVDPGDAAPVRRYLDAHGLRLRAILVTHHHPDHVGGVAALARAGVPVHGPRAEAARIPALNQLLDDGDVVDVLGTAFTVMALPGHTLGHIAYLGDGALLCGDTLFSAGCGRLFEGTPAQMHASLSRLAALPADTRVYCTHEYTMSNLAFATAVEPANAEVLRRIEDVRALRAQDRPSLPSSIGVERRINPFLRTGEPAVIEAAQDWAGTALSTDEAVFAALRRWKDVYKPPAAV